MKKVFAYKKDTGIVAHMAQGGMFAPNLEQISLDVTDVQIQQIESNKYNLRIENGQLVMEKRKTALLSEAKEALLNKIDAGSITLADLKPFLKELLTQ